MSRTLSQQRRGAGRTGYKSHQNKQTNVVEYVSSSLLKSKIIGFRKDRIIKAPLVVCLDPSGNKWLNYAVKGLVTGNYVNNQFEIGSCCYLKDVPEGALICNLQITPESKKSFLRSPGTYGKIVLKTEEKIVVRLVSKKEREFHPNCLCTLGIIGGADRASKPLVKAGNNFKRWKNSPHKFPSVNRKAMNIINHPYGGKKRRTPGRVTVSSRHSSPGQKVGSIAAKRTGRGGKKK